MGPDFLVIGPGPQSEQFLTDVSHGEVAGDEIAGERGPAGDVAQHDDLCRLGVALLAGRGLNGGEIGTGGLVAAWVGSDTVVPPFVNFG